MSGGIENFFRAAASAVASSASFRAVLEDHLSYLRTAPGTRIEEVSAHNATVYNFDWIGLLNKINIPVELHWITIRLNGGRSYTDFTEDIRSLYIPDSVEVNKLLQLHMSARRQK